MNNPEEFYNLVLSIRGDRNIFVETGTAVGETAAWASDNFDRVISIEFMDDLYRSCIERFWDTKNVDIIHGDSSDWIELFEFHIADDAVWFLDAHNVNRSDGLLPPSETPIVKELKTIFKSYQDHIVIVDDLRLFGSETGYPSMSDIHNLSNLCNFDIEINRSMDLFIASKS
jgi:hypothetical protein